MDFLKAHKSNPKYISVYKARAQMLFGLRNPPAYIVCVSDLISFVTPGNSKT